MKILKLLAMVVCVSALSQPMNAQSSCAEKYRTANELRESGLATKDAGKLLKSINLYRNVSVCEPNLKSKCNNYIKEAKKAIKDMTPDLSISTSEITIPYQGGDELVDVASNGKWNIEGMTDWCKTNAYSAKNFIVQCRDMNNSTREKVTTLLVKNGSKYQSLKVIQAGRPEYIEVGAKELAFPAAGTEENLSVKSNANWEVRSIPSWCKVEKGDSVIRIIVSPNTRTIERNDDIVIESPSKSVTIKIHQGAGEEKLTLSQNDLEFSAYGDVHYIKVYTDADNWFLGDFPTWMDVQKVGNDSIRIECGKNVPNGEPREGSVQVRTDRQTVGVKVVQQPREPIILFGDPLLVSGRNLSFGISASYYMPFIGASAGGDYKGSVVDYGLGNSTENASYKSATGFSFGLFADCRLYKNIFLTAGANFTMVKYKNTFGLETTYTLPYKSYEYMKGKVQNAYKEEYTHTMIEVPILASYRFKINDVSHVQINFGPVLNFGLSAKMKLSGNTDCENMHIYNSTTGDMVDGGNYVRHTAANADFNLYQSCVLWNESYTTGNDAPVDHHDTFSESPMHRFNMGLRLGVAYEVAGLSFGLSYTQMLTNMANKGYWENERFTVLNNSDVTMRGYKHRINTLEFKLAYTLRYLKTKKNR